MNEEQGKALISATLKCLAGQHRDTLDRLKSEAYNLYRPDFLWHYLLQSFATMGNTRGWQGLLGNPENYKLVTFDALAALSRDDRLVRLETTLIRAKVRMAKKKAGWLQENFERILQMGGLATANARILALTDREELLTFLQAFSGVGPKYARNIMMDVHHPALRESIAIDERIKSVTKALGLRFRNYREEEHFYLSAAKGAGLTGWEADRLLYNFRAEVLEQLERPSYHGGVND